MSLRNSHRSSIKQAVLPLWDFISQLSLVIFIVLSLVIIVITEVDNNMTKKLRTYMVDLSAPALSFAAKPIETLRNIKQNAGYYFSVYDENKLLRQRNEYLENMHLVMVELKTENKRLREMVNYLPTQRKSYKTARIVSDNRGIYTKSAIISSGAKDGLKDGHIVTNKQGLVGRIYDVGQNSARLLYINDMNSRVPVTIGQAKSKAILTGNSQSELVLKFASKDAGISVGDRVVTSGDGQYFPIGLPVGVVKEVSNETILVAPYMDRNRLDYVTVISLDNAVE